ncbi:unnamed protein product [Cochlearia groenlandica]
MGDRPTSGADIESLKVELATLNTRMEEMVTAITTLPGQIANAMQGGGEQRGPNQNQQGRNNPKPIRKPLEEENLLEEETLDHENQPSHLSDIVDVSEKKQVQIFAIILKISNVVWCDHKILFSSWYMHKIDRNGIG